MCVCVYVSTRKRGDICNTYRHIWFLTHHHSVHHWLEHPTGRPAIDAPHDRGPIVDNLHPVAVEAVNHWVPPKDAYFICVCMSVFVYEYTCAEEPTAVKRIVHTHKRNFVLLHLSLSRSPPTHSFKITHTHTSTHKLTRRRMNTLLITFLAERLRLRQRHIALQPISKGVVPNRHPQPPALLRCPHKIKGCVVRLHFLNHLRGQDPMEVHRLQEFVVVCVCVCVCVMECGCESCEMVE